jgi:hypothetical protein
MGPITATVGPEELAIEHGGALPSTIGRHAAEAVDLDIANGLPTNLRVEPHALLAHEVLTRAAEPPNKNGPPEGKPLIGLVAGVRNQSWQPH